jgi:hypothetical protein
MAGSIPRGKHSDKQNVMTKKKQRSLSNANWNPSPTEKKLSDAIRPVVSMHAQITL